MRNAFNKEMLRTIARSAGRFVAIAIIALLGAGFYAGLRMAAPDMRIAADRYFDATNTFDFSVTTTYGIDDESVSLLRDVEGVEQVMPVHQAEGMAATAGGRHTLHIESLPRLAFRGEYGGALAEMAANCLNQPLLIEGRWPDAADECVIGGGLVSDGAIPVGTRIEFDEVADERGGGLAHSELTVVGIVSSPAYISSNQLGPTSLGSGKLELFAYVDEAAFLPADPYALAYLIVEGAAGRVWDNASYDEVIDDERRRIEAVADDVALRRWQAVKENAQAELDQAVSEYEAQSASAAQLAAGGYEADALESLLADARAELADAQEQVDDIAVPDVFVLDRAKNPGMAALSSDAEGIAQIATFLPFMFFLVAALVSLTSMTRMVDEERTEIGTHKALGYSRGRITSKYLIYGALASGIGALIGIILLGKLLPWFIMTSYSVTYDVPELPTPLDFMVTARALAFSLGVTMLATWGAAAASLRETPAALMLPKAPKAGKRIILEHIRPLWVRLSFSHKVTARNLLRYKRRFFMAVIGVAGCTALLMVGFGLRDAIGAIVSNQFQELVRYDVAVRLDDAAADDQRLQVEEAMEENGALTFMEVMERSMIAEGPEDDMRIEVVVPSQDDELSRFVTLRERVSRNSIDLADSQVVLTEKAAEVLGVSAGDEVTLFDESAVGDKSGQGHVFKVGAVAENYLGHYVYMTPAAYEGALAEPAVFDSAYVELADDVEPSGFEDALLAHDAVSTVSFVADEMATYDEMLDVMNKLIFVIVLLSASLAFVVLYNLTNINITERVREIATLKVLGFTRGEVNSYIFREVVVMALIGAIAGCLAGVPLTSYIAEAAETANMMFGRVIEPASFASSFLMTMAFTFIVAFAMRRKLAHVDMVESLKSVE